MSIKIAERAAKAPGFVATKVNRKWLFACNISFEMDSGTSRLSELAPFKTKLNTEPNSEKKYTYHHTITPVFPEG